MNKLIYHKLAGEDTYLVYPTIDYEFQIQLSSSILETTLLLRDMRRTITVPAKTEEEARDWVLLKLISGELKLVNMRYQ